MFADTMDRQRRDTNAGKRHAREVFNLECYPNWERIGQASEAFRTAFRAEWDQITAYRTIVPGRDAYGNRRRVEL